MVIVSPQDLGLLLFPFQTAFLWMFPKKNGLPPKSSILIEFSIIFTIYFKGNTPIFGFPPKWLLHTGGLRQSNYFLLSNNRMTSCCKVRDLPPLGLHPEDPTSSNHLTQKWMEIPQRWQKSYHFPTKNTIKTSNPLSQKTTHYRWYMGREFFEWVYTVTPIGLLISPTNPWGFPTKNDQHLGCVVWGETHHLRKHPYANNGSWSTPWWILVVMLRSRFVGKKKQNPIWSQNLHTWQFCEWTCPVWDGDSMLSDLLERFISWPPTMR